MITFQKLCSFDGTRGRTFENAVVVPDEAQNVTAAQMKKFLSCQGDNVTATPRSVICPLA